MWMRVTYSGVNSAHVIIRNKINYWYNRQHNIKFPLRKPGVRHINHEGLALSKGRSANLIDE